MKLVMKAALGAAVVFASWTGLAAAQTKINIGCTATTDCASAAVALEDGIFKKNGLDATMTLIGLNSNIPAALLSDSVQIGGPTPSVFLQAVDGGLDLVAVAGASSTSKTTFDTAGVVASPASGIKEPKDFVGKKVGAPGIGAFLQVLFSKWLIDNGVDPKQVNFVEVTFPTMNDTLKSGAVDAVVTAEPMMSRIIASGTGTVAGYYLEKLPERRPAILYASTRAWADANPDTVKAFRASIEEAAKIMLRMHISGLPVIDDAGNLVGVVSESDFLRRSEIGTGRRHAAWLKFFMGPGRAAAEFVHERGRKVEDVMTKQVVSVQEDTDLAELVDLMEKNDIKRVPVMRGKTPVGIVTRTNLLQAVASLLHEIPDPTADDEHIRERITRAVNGTDWRPIGFEVNVRKGVVHLHGLVTTDEARQAAIVAAESTAGVKEVHDHLCFVDTYTGFYVESPEDMKAAG